MTPPPDTVATADPGKPGRGSVGSESAGGIDPLLVVALALPMAGLALLLAAPSLDVTWEHHPSHFWLVLAAGGLNAVLAYATGTAARRRDDARVFLVSLAFLSAAGFLGLHALATPGVLLETPNAGFVIATPFGLVLAAGFAAASGADLEGERGRWVMARAGLLQNGLIAVMIVWGLGSLSGAPPLDASNAVERASGPLLALSAVGVALYAVAVVRYLGLLRHRPTSMGIAMVTAFVLLGEAMVAVAFGRNWHATWWEWHLLMLAAFALVARGAQRQWHEERFSDLYLDQTRSGQRDVSVLFADLSGFTSFSERHADHEVTEMLNTYFERAIPPIVEQHGGHIDRIIGDALMAVFNRDGRRPDHPRDAARAGLALVAATEQLAESHPGWPHFRVGINTGMVAMSVLGTRGGRTQTAIGDTVNLAARIESAAPVAGVGIGPETRRRLEGRSTTQPLGALSLKGKSEPVEVAHLLSVE